MNPAFKSTSLAIGPVEEALGQRVLHRIRQDLKEILSENSTLPNIFVCPDDETVTRIHAIIVGPSDTPYEGGFFYFVLKLPSDYPINPPTVKLMTTGNGAVRFNPNLYNCGKVCLSILGTWEGPKWTSVMSVQSVLVSISSLMSEKPFFNEPGYDGKQAAPGFISQSNDYNQAIRMNVLRVAINDMLTNANRDSKDMPEVFRELIKRHVKVNFDKYESFMNKNLKTKGLLSAESIKPYAEAKDKLTKFKNELRLDENMADEMYGSLKSAYAPHRDEDPQTDADTITDFNSMIAEADFDSD